MNSYPDDGGIYAGGSGYNPKADTPIKETPVIKQRTETAIPAVKRLSWWQRLINFISIKLKRKK